MAGLPARDPVVSDRDLHRLDLRGNVKLFTQTHLDRHTIDMSTPWHENCVNRVDGWALRGCAIASVFLAMACLVATQSGDCLWSP